LYSNDWRLIDESKLLAGICFMNKPYKLNVFQLSNDSFINFIDPEYDAIHRDSNKLVEDDSLYQSIGVESNVNKKK
jgi:hypothetical protein